MARGTLFPLLLTLLPLVPVLFSLSNTLPIPPAPPVPPALPDLPSETEPTPKIALLHMYNSVHFFARLGKLTGENKARYAKRHNYDMVHSTPLLTSGILKEVHCEHEHSKVVSGPDSKGRCWGHHIDFEIDHSRAPTFGKIKLALAACNGRDNGWLLWTDADAMIVNQTIPLESLIDDAYDLMLAYDWLMLNAGMLLFKCSDWTKSFLTQVYNARQFDSARALDQSSFQDHIDHLSTEDRETHIKVVPKHAMNVYIEEYRAGDFLLHMAGKLYEATEPGLYAIANQFDILSMVDDVEDVEAFFRGRHLLNYYSGTCKVESGQRQRDCKPQDPRRILLNESLGSMSYPNRYRHVGMRYYWLGDWKDKYDKPGWDAKKRSLSYLAKPPHAEMPPPPPSLLQHDGQLEVPDLHANEEQKDVLADTLNTEKKPTQARHSELKKGSQQRHEDEGAMADSESDDDDNEANGWPMYVWLLVLSLGMAVVSGCAYVLKRRRTKGSKMQ